MTVYWDLDYFATVSILQARDKFQTLASLRLEQCMSQRIQGDIQVGMARERMTHTHMLVVQATEAEQLARGDNHLLREHALEDQAHIHWRHRL